MAFTKIDLIKELARGMDALVIDSTVGSVPDRSVFNDEALQFKMAEQLEGKQVYTYGAVTPASALIDEFVPGSVPTLKLIPSLAATPTGAYMVLDHYTINELRQVAEESIKAAGKYYFIPIVASLAVVATQYQYTVPSGFAFIHDIHFIPTAGTGFDELSRYSVPRNWWTIENKKLIFNPENCNLDNYNNEYFEIRGQAKPPLLSTDSTTYDDILEEYLVARSIESLSWRRIQESEGWRYKYYAARDKRKEEEITISTGIAANAVRTGL